MLKNVKWGEFKLGELFDIERTLSFNSDMLTAGNEYDYVTRTSLNQGVLQTTGFINIENINSEGMWSLGLLQMDFFYRNKPWYAGQFVRKIVPKIEIPKSAIMYFTTILNKQRHVLLSVLVRNVDETFKNIVVKLPITDNNSINYDFIETFIAELEAERLAELEAERLAELTAYLTVSGFENYELTDEELAAIQKFEKLNADNWGKYKIGDLFEKISTKKLPYKAKELPKQPLNEYILPCLTSSFQNQGLNYYAPSNEATVLKNVISIPSNSDVYRAYYQTREFTVLSDAYAIRWKLKKQKLSQNQYLFMVMCINKVTDLPIYSYKNKLGGWNVVKEKYIKLPQINNEIDFDFIDTFISAIKKISIKDVVDYSNRKMKLTKKIVNCKV